MHYYQFNIADYRKDTAHLSPIEHYIYRTLIDWYYLDEVPIPKITQSVMRRLRLVSEEEANALRNVLNDFFLETNDGFVHNRIEQEILEYHKRCGTNKENGKKGGRPKSIPEPEKTQSVNFANPNESKTNPNQEPITNNHKPITNNQEPLKSKPIVVDSDSKESSSTPRKKNSEKSEEMPIQNLVPQELWDSFLKVRSKAKAVNTPQAIKCLITELKKLKEQGNDPVEVVTQSIRSSWKDVYPIKNRGSPIAISSRESYNKQQTELAKQRLFGNKQSEEKDITNESKAL